MPHLDDAAAVIERPVVERLQCRLDPEVAFCRKVRQGHGDRCAMSGLMLRNCGGRTGVLAAHILPVEHQRSASWRNGLARSGRLHRMFDHGLISVADDCATILVSQEKGTFGDCGAFVSA